MYLSVEHSSTTSPPVRIPQASTAQKLALYVGAVNIAFGFAVASANNASLTLFRQHCVGFGFSRSAKYVGWVELREKALRVNVADAISTAMGIRVVFTEEIPDADCPLVAIDKIREDFAALFRQKIGDREEFSRPEPSNSFLFDLFNASLSITGRPSLWYTMYGKLVFHTAKPGTHSVAILNFVDVELHRVKMNSPNQSEMMGLYEYGVYEIYRRHSGGIRVVSGTTRAEVPQSELLAYVPGGTGLARLSLFGQQFARLDVCDCHGYVEKLMFEGDFVKDGGYVKILFGFDVRILPGITPSRPTYVPFDSERIHNRSSSIVDT